MVSSPESAMTRADHLEMPLSAEWEAHGIEANVWCLSLFGIPLCLLWSFHIVKKRRPLCNNIVVQWSPVILLE